MFSFALKSMKQILLGLKCLGKQKGKNVCLLEQKIISQVFFNQSQDISSPQIGCRRHKKSQALFDIFMNIFFFTNAS